METIDESVFTIISRRSIEEEIIDVILKKLGEDKDKVCYFFRNPPVFLTERKIWRIVKLMTNKYWLAHATSEEDCRNIGLKVTRHGMIIFKEGGLLEHLKTKVFV